MNNFQLDSRLADDCILLGEMNISLLLLNKNAIVPWFILVPKTREIELTDLPQSEQRKVLEEINLLSSFVKVNFDISKLNVAAIGNVVSQLHIHVIGRDPSDYCWPSVVWGRDEKKSYTNEEIDVITLALRSALGDKLKSFGI
jgi:diadenosine tetraphosphate (Ap4A) HIT family hydrolase